MNEFKWIVSDLDGTLIHHRDAKTNIIYKEVVDELHRAIKGKKFTIATGRHYKDVLDINQKFKINMPKDSFIIGMNGCQIYSTASESLLVNKTLDDDIVKNEVPKIITYLDKILPNSSLIFGYGENENIYFIKNESSEFEKMTQDVLEHEDNSGVFTYSTVESVNDLENITKFCIDFSKSLEDPLALISNLRKISDKIDYANTSDSFVELIIKDVTKATGLEYINEKFYNINTENILVFGDAGNDIEMMDYAGTAITRKDARPEIIAIANKTYDGGASVFVKNALIDLVK
ncbi:MAG: HAD-IIB family hydrolase [Metamycoplasmataceae bacterium]